MAVLLAHLKVPLAWGHIFRRTYQDALKDNVLGMRQLRRDVPCHRRGRDSEGSYNFRNRTRLTA
jgi:hypothetical protein